MLQLFDQYFPGLLHLLDVIRHAEGRPYIVGGAVRDALTGRLPKDVDIEVFQLPFQELERVLSQEYKVDAVGRSFGVLKVQVGSSTIDVALPRTESKVGDGHKGFVTTADPWMPFALAAARRDFTINAIGFDVIKDTIVDPHGGCQDLSRGILRHVSPAFDEDPLRVLRACQFAARFDMVIAPETLQRCLALTPELPTLAVERLWEEWKKLLKADFPSTGLFALLDTGAVSLFPEVCALVGVPQDLEWHPEFQGHPLGSLWGHNCMVTDAATLVLRDDGVSKDDDDEYLIVMLAAFCHDLGKPATTVFDRGRWRSPAHEEAGEAPTRSFLARIGCPPAIIEAVVPLVMNHLKPFHFARDKASASAIRRLALKAPLERLCRVARADFLGRTTPDALACRDSRTIQETVWLLEQAAALKVHVDGPKPLLLGRHLLSLGMSPGRLLGDVLKAAFEAQLDGVFSDLDGAILWAKAALGTKDGAA